MSKAFEYVIQNRGIDTDSAYPYTAKVELPLLTVGFSQPVIWKNWKSWEGGVSH